ncbi:MAG: hypothetical protein FIA97_08935, partial [Methylococcaceae bacterium]|nr:hypothetical protein [Methylococcaceae bacterium]
PDQHLQMARMRALESGRYLLRATNTGVTAIVSPRGTVVVRGAPFEQAVVTGSILPMQGATPYVLAGDWAMLALLAGVGGSLAYPRWRRRGSRDAACQDRGRGPQQRRRVPAPVP